MAKKKAAKKTAKKAAAKKTTKKKATKKSKAAESGDGDEVAPKKKKKKATKKRTRKKAGDARMKIYWGVFNHAMKRVALYDFNQRKAAEKRVKELAEAGKPPHFVAKIKEEIEEK